MRVLVDERLGMSQQCVLGAQKANRILVCMKSSVVKQVKEDDPATVLLSEKIPPRVLSPALGSPAQEGYQPFGSSPEKGQQVDVEGAPVLQGKAERIGIVQPGKEKTSG
ncbi:hypothetical protein BTVI_10866 [Pitangus sulphuratus]|nr:hypothetical protein BTVI_10866 [Pitangus sulphuratus]